MRATINFKDSNAGVDAGKEEHLLIAARVQTGAATIETNVEVP